MIKPSLKSPKVSILVVKITFDEIKIKSMLINTEKNTEMVTDFVPFL